MFCMFLISHPCGAEFAWLLYEMELNKGAGRQFSELRGQDAESGFVIVVSGLFLFSVSSNDAQL